MAPAILPRIILDLSMFLYNFQVTFFSWPLLPGKNHNSPFTGENREVKRLAQGTPAVSKGTSTGHQGSGWEHGVRPLCRPALVHAPCSNHPESSSLTPNWSPQGHSNPTPLTQAPHLLPSLRYEHTKPLINLLQTLSPPIPLAPFSVASGHSGLLGSRSTNYNLDCRTFKTLSPSSRPAHTVAAPSAQGSNGPDSLQLRALPRFPIKEEARMPEPGPSGFFWRFPGSGPTSLQHRLTHVSTSSNGPPWSPPTRLSHCCLRTFAHAGLPPEYLPCFSQLTPAISFFQGMVQVPTPDS